MSFLVDLINPPPTASTLEDHYQFFKDQFTGLSALQYIKNDSIVTNSNFSTLSAKGLTPTTQADGDNIEFIQDWFVYGASNASYTITPTPYPHDSLVKSSSEYYIHLSASAYSSGAFYFYQKQDTTARKYQKDYFTYGFIFKNNQTKPIQVRLDIYTNYGTSSVLKTGKPFDLQPGQKSTAIASTILTDSLAGVSVNASNYTEFRLNFIDLRDGTADIDIYQIKCEPGQISTPL